MARFMVKASEYKNVCKAVNDKKLADLKKEIIEILKKQDEKEFKKAVDLFESQEIHYSHLEKSITGKWVEKAGYGVGTVRIWKGKKYKKIAPGKWARVFDKEGRGTNIAIGKLIAKVNKIDNAEDLLQFVLENKQRFVDENGKELDILDKVRAAVDTRQETISGRSNDYTYGLDESVNRAKDKLFEDKDKINAKEADLHKISRKISQIPTTELKKRKEKLDRWIENKTRSKRDSLNNTIWRDNYIQEVTAINKELEKRESKKETSKPAEKKLLKDKEYEYYKNNLSTEDDLENISKDIKKEREYLNNRKDKPGVEQRLKELNAKEKVVNELLEEKKNKPAEKKEESTENLEAALKEVEDAIDNAGDYDDIEELEKERQQLLKQLGKKPAEKKEDDYSKMSEDELNELNKKLRQTIKEKDYGEADEEIEQINKISKQKIINSYKTREKHTLQHVEGVEQKKKMIADSKAIVEKDLAKKEKQRAKESSIAKKNQMADEINELKYMKTAFEQLEKEIESEAEKTSKKEESDYVQKKRDAKEGYWSDEFKERNMNNIKQKIAAMKEEGASDKKIKTYLEETIETNTNDIPWRERAIEEGRIKGNQANDYRDTIQERTVRIENCKELLKEYETRVEKSLEETFLMDMAVEDEIQKVEEEQEEESLFDDYSAEQPELFNSTAMKVREAFNRCNAL